MSHFSVAVITKEVPSMDVLDEALAPFDEDLEMEPYIVSDFETVKMKIHDDCHEYLTADEAEPILKALEANDIEALRKFNKEQYWFYDLDAKGNAISTYNPDSQWDWWVFGGRWSNVLGKEYVQIKDYPKDVACNAVLTPDGVWHDSGLGFVPSKEAKSDWIQEFYKILSELPQDYYLSVVDCHI